MNRPIASRERPTLRTTAALGICYLGLAIAFVHETGASAGGEQIVLGSLWVFGSAVVFAFYFLGTGIMIQRVGSMRLAGLAGGTSSLMVLTHYLVVADLSLVTQFPRAVWIYAALMAVFSTVLPIYWAALAIERIGAVSAAAIGNIGPLLTVIASWVILGEPVSPFQIAGLALVLLGVSRVKPRPMIKPLAGDCSSVPHRGSVTESEPKLDRNDFAEDTASRTRRLPR